MGLVQGQNLATGTAEDLSVPIGSDPRLRSCIQCGTCGGVCPYGLFMDYPPVRMISALRANTFEDVTNSDTIWMCVACYACATQCPAQIPLTRELMARTKEELILSGKVPLELQTALENSQRYGNPQGESPRKRTDWTRGLEGVVKTFGRDTRQAEILWYVGDYASFHPRVQPATRLLARILQTLGVDFAILGNDEWSDGDSQRLAGERGLFELLAEKNARTMRRFKFERILTTDPHAYNAIKNEYPSMGIAYPIQHYTEFLAGYLDTLRPLFTNPVNARVTYHDPCYLGRVNHVYEQPRRLLSAIPGITLAEMPHNHQTSLCCGGGGGGMWLDGFIWEKAHARLSEWRVQEAMQIGADILVVACPYEVSRFEDATKTIPGAEKLVVRDMAELLSAALNINE